MKKIILHGVVCAIFFTVSTGCGKVVDQPRKSKDVATEKGKATSTTTTDSQSSTGHTCGNHSGSGSTGH